MKHISLLLIILSFNGLSYCQGLFDNDNKTREAVIATADSTVYLSVLTENPKRFKASLDKSYTWYSNKQIHSSKGEYSGYLLHGVYEAFNTSGILLTKGSYLHGNKTGTWMYYRNQGSLQMIEEWNKGVIISRNVYNSRGKTVITKVFTTKSETKEEKEDVKSAKATKNAKRQQKKLPSEQVAQKKDKTKTQTSGTKKKNNLKLFEKKPKNNSSTSASPKDVSKGSKKEKSEILDKLKNIFPTWKKDKEKR